MNDINKKIRFTCTGCDSGYSLTRGEAAKLPGSVMTCATCGKKIKIAFCPDCGTSYSITFSAPMKQRYTLKCRRCSSDFPIEFPEIRDALPKHPPAPPAERKVPVAVNKPSAPPVKRERIIIEERSRGNRGGVDTGHLLSLPDRSFLQGFPALLAGVFGIRRLGFAAAAVIALFVLLGVTDLAESTLQNAALVKGNTFLLHLLNFFSIFAISFILTLSNTVMARLCLGELDPKIDTAPRGIIVFAAARVLPVLAGNVALLLALNALLVIFGAIPLVGPILYALLFLPVYVLSVATVLVSAVAFWFYPPVLAYHGAVASGITEFSRFIKKHALNLVLVVPVLVIITAIFTALLNLVHQGAMTLLLAVSRGVLGNEAGRIFSAVPFGLQRAVNFPQMLSSLRSLRLFLGDLLFSYHAGALILGLTLGVISVALLSVVFSFIGSLAAHSYFLLENRRQMDARKKIELLVVVFLVLAVLFLFKKVFL
jgi:uncharacterized membrane protein/transcription elongation factor Elf1